MRTYDPETKSLEEQLGIYQSALLKVRLALGLGRDSQDDLIEVIQAGRNARGEEVAQYKRWYEVEYKRAEAAEKRLEFVLNNTPLTKIEEMCRERLFSLTGEYLTRKERYCVVIDAALEEKK